MSRIITRNQAAEMLKCTPQTISNMIKNGVITAHKMKGREMIDADTIERYFDTFEDVINTGKRIEEMKNEISRQESEIRIHLANTNLIGNLVTTQINKKLLLYLLSQFKDNMNQRTYDIIEYCINNDKANLGEVADKFDLTRARIQQLVAICLKKIKFNDPYKKLLLENKSLIAANDILNENLTKMKYVVELCEIEENKKNAIVDKCTKLAPILDTYLIDYCLSVRVLNCMKCNNIYTVRDLVKIPRIDLLKFRNIGRKSYREVCDFIEQHFGDRDFMLDNSEENSEKSEK